MVCFESGVHLEPITEDRERQCSDGLGLDHEPTPSSAEDGMVFSCIHIEEEGKEMGASPKEH